MSKTTGTHNANNSRDIRREIADARLLRIRDKGHNQGISLPQERTAPLVPFAQGIENSNRDFEKFIICEVKKRSPSKGDINMTMDPATQAGLYRKSGIKSVSVLTEEAYFGGSLQDLVDVKTACPELSILRKDFLLDTEDVRVSFRAGADAFLLIAGLLDKDLMEEMHKLGLEMGMTPLVELHDIEDIEKARQFKPQLVGINSRNLKTFQIDPLRPLKIRSMIDWDCRVVFESGIHTKENALFAFGTGFSGILVGEAVVRDPKLIPRLIEAGGIDLFVAEKRYSAWEKLFRRFSFTRPFIKVCGITEKKDAQMAVDFGADLIGFVLAESPREVNADFVRSVSRDIMVQQKERGEKPVLKSGVVVLKNTSSDETLPLHLQELLDDGSLDFIQFHGEESPDFTIRFPGYKALRIGSEKDLQRKKDFLQPATLIDAFSKEAYGGTGKRIDEDLIVKAKEQGSLWLAGGLNPENIFEICQKFQPDLIDVSSGLEAKESPDGKKRKDPVKTEKFFKEIKRYENLQ